jgi:hypothetical protein
LTAETTTAPAASIRELAIAATEQANREHAEREAAEHAQELETIVRLAARHARQILDEVAEGAEWTALDEETAYAWIGGEPFRYRRRDGHWLYHVTTCPTCGKGRTAGIFNLEGLGDLLRDGDPDAYDCETCEAAARDQRELAAAARAEAEAALPPLPTARDREGALCDAAEYHQLAKDRFGQGDEGGATAAAAVAQSASALARAIQQDVQAWGESS